MAGAQGEACKAQSSLPASPPVLALLQKSEVGWSFQGRKLRRQQVSDSSKVSQPINSRPSSKRGKQPIVKIIKMNNDIYSILHLFHGRGMENHQIFIVRLLVIGLLFFIN